MEPGSLTRPLPAFLGALAVARLTRLVVADEITRRPRLAIIRWAEGTDRRPAHPQLGYLATCPWCVSPYLAAGWALLTVCAPRSAGVAGTILAWSQIAGLAAEVT